MNNKGRQKLPDEGQQPATTADHGLMHPQKVHVNEGPSSGTIALPHEQKNLEPPPSNIMQALPNMSKKPALNLLQ